MTLSYVGQINLGVLTPISLSVAGSLTTAISSQITAFTDLSAGLTAHPPSFAASISALATLTTALTASLSLPSVDFQAAAVADAITTLTAELTTPLAFASLLNGAAGIFSYAYGGTGASLGPSVSSALSSSWPDGTSSATSSNAVVIGTVTPSVWGNIETFFGAIPPSLPAGLTYLAEMNLGALCPLCVTSTAGVIAGLHAQLNGLVALAANLTLHPPSFTTSLTLAAQLTSTLNAAISLGLPGVSFQLAAVAKAVAALNANLSLLASLTASLGGAGAFVWSYSGTGAGLGPAITSALSGGWPDGTSSSTAANALVLGTVTPAVWTTITSFFGGL